MKYITSKKLLNAHQIDAAMEFLRKKGDLDLTEEEFEKNVGVNKFLIKFLKKFLRIF